MPLRRALLVLLPAVLLLAPAPPRASAQEVRVSIDAARGLRAVNPLLYGVNTARWDESLFPGPDSAMLLSCDRDAIRKVRDAGITLLKYPGGNDADSYIWNAPGNNTTEMSTDEYIAFCRAAGAEPFITVNFNGGPDLAPSWVRYCRERGYNVRYWEVGDEQWGTWARGHAAPEVYARTYIALVKAMRAWSCRSPAAPRRSWRKTAAWPSGPATRGAPGPPGAPGPRIPSGSGAAAGPPGAAAA